MAKSRMFQVVNGRMHFKCSNCAAKRMVSVPPGVRSRTIRCHKCAETTRCMLNRRRVIRETQLGKVQMTTGDGREVEVDLFDISLYGVGFELPLRDSVRVKVGREVQFRCSWQPQLFGSGRYVVRSINGRRVGVERS